jgi:uncharacterized protein
MTDPSDRTAPLVWVVTDGKVGIVNQAVGLAEATGFPFIEKVIALRAPWRWLPANIWPPGLRGTSAEGDQLTPPWPDMVISCGRQSIGPARAIKAKSGAFHVHIQHPRMSLLSFDLLVVPEHDCLTGDNVVATRGAIHRITPTRLAEAAKTFAPMLAGLPRPLIAVLIGGGSRAHQLTPTLTRDIAARLRTFAAETGGGLAVTASRRTGADNEAILRAQLSGDNAFVWDGEGENPYFGLLGLADHIVVTTDSVNMVSEACRTGKPVHVIDLDGGSAKFDSFHRQFRDAGFTRPFTGKADQWSYVPLDETGRAAAEIHKRFNARASSANSKR